MNPTVRRKLRKGGTVLVLLIIAMLLGLWKWPYNPDRTFLLEPDTPSTSDIKPHDPRRIQRRSSEVIQKNSRPSKDHCLGLDRYYRDVFSRLLAGTQLYLLAGSCSALMALVIGTTLGILWGMYGHEETTHTLEKSVGWGMLWTHNVIASFPKLVILLLGVSITYLGVWPIMTAVGFLNIPRVMQAVRLKVHSLRKEQFIEAARSLGLSDRTIITRHILRYACLRMSPIYFVALLADAIIVETSLGFLGYGDQLSWGTIVVDHAKLLSKSTVFSWDVFPAYCATGVILLTLWGFTQIGKGLELLLSPRRQ